MIDDPTLWRRLGQLDPKDPHIAFLLQCLLDYRASTKDNEVNSQLLQDIILKYAAAEAKLVALNKELIDKQRRLNEDLAAAAEIQYSLLPHTIEASKHIQVAWAFKPCEQIGGDIFNLIQLDQAPLWHIRIGCQRPWGTGRDGGGFRISTSCRPIPAFWWNAARIRPQWTTSARPVRFSGRSNANFRLNASQIFSALSILCLIRPPEELFTAMPDIRHR